MVFYCSYFVNFGNNTAVFSCHLYPILAKAGLGICNPSGFTNKKARFQLFKAPFFFVGWLAPAYRDM